LNVSVLVCAGACREVAGLAENPDAGHEGITRASDRVRWDMTEKAVFRRVRQSRTRREERPAIHGVEMVMVPLMGARRPGRLRTKRYRDRRERKGRPKSR
jgi:hypothetical protein